MNEIRLERRRGMRRLVALAGIALAACTGAVGPPLPPPPAVNTAGFSPRVQAQLEDAQSVLEREPSSAQANGKLGMILHAYGLFDGAAGYYARARALAPDTFVWPFYHALVLEHLGQPDAAIAALRAALALKPSDLDAQLKLATLLRRMVRTEESRDIYDNLAFHFPEEPRVAFAHGRLLLETGEPAGALAPLRRALALAGDYGDLHHALASTYRQLDDPERAARHQALHERYREQRLLGIDTLPPEVALLDLTVADAVERARAAQGPQGGPRRENARAALGRLAAIEGRHQEAIAYAAAAGVEEASWLELSRAIVSADKGQPLIVLPALLRARESAAAAGDEELREAIDRQLRRLTAEIEPAERGPSR